jgi:hypothetical protein
VGRQPVQAFRDAAGFGNNDFWGGSHGWLESKVFRTCGLALVLAP